MYKRELEDLVSFLESQPNIQELATYLGTNACLSGELSKVYIGRVGEDNTISSVATFGYKDTELELVKNIDLQLRKPICIIAREHFIIYRNNTENFYLEFPDAARFSDPWKSILCIPLPPRYVMSIAFQVSAEDNVNYYEYFETMTLLIRMFLNIHLASNDRDYDAKNSSEMLGKPLTDRQQIIHLYMEKGMVNREIAEQINYSESLVRQETIIIFAKLGVTGRRELLIPKSTVTADVPLGY